MTPVRALMSRCDWTAVAVVAVMLAVASVPSFERLIAAMR
jgi:hypothetical protein